MSPRTDLNNAIIYSIFVRNHSAAGTLNAVIDSLPRLRQLGVDLLWLMPLQPAGELERKGSLGSPYAQKDYRAIAPELGDFSDLKRLQSECHRLGLKLLIDCVFNHVAPDSVLAQEHPSWLLRTAEGQPKRKCPDWEDVVDLDFSQAELRTYLIETLCLWADYVDGFRCDVASLVPVDFWLQARQKVAEKHPETIWLAESVEPSFVDYLRSQSYYCACDAELYAAFDLLYEYDIQSSKAAFLSGAGSLANWLHDLSRQRATLPQGALKLRFLENHDQDRIAAAVQGLPWLKNWHCFSFLLPGPQLLYEGTEYALSHRPSLFEPDPIAWPQTQENDLAQFLSRLAQVKKELGEISQFSLEQLKDSALLCLSLKTKTGDNIACFVELKRSGAALEPVVREQFMRSALAPGWYEELLTGVQVELSAEEGKQVGLGLPLVLRRLP